MRWEIGVKEEAKQCEPGEELVECFPGRLVDYKTPSRCDRLALDPDIYFLSSIRRYRRYCRSAPDMPRACLSGDAELRCETECGYSGGAFRVAQKCEDGSPACDSYLHSKKYYRIRKAQGNSLFYCGPNPKRTAEFRGLSAQWGKTLEDCARLNAKSAPEAIRCEAGETARYCEATWSPNDPQSCAAFQGKRGYYDLPKASGSSLHGSPVKHVYCELPPEEAARREAGFQKCLGDALNKRRQVLRGK